MTIGPFIVRVARDGRLHLARFGVRPGQSYKVSTDDEGRIHLVPVDPFGKEKTSG
jgi:hypothetical protein